MSYCSEGVMARPDNNLGAGTLEHLVAFLRQFVTLNGEWGSLGQSKSRHEG